MRFDSACNLCASPQLRDFASRSDGTPVLVCTVCGHGIVREFPDDALAMYGDDYFSSDGKGQGYQDYAYMAEHGVSWAAALIRLLRPGGRILDIGCADGRLLSKLGDGFQLAGIEPNQKLAAQCREAGIDVIAADLMDEKLRLEYAGSFDIVSAIAVFEHLPDFRGAVETAMAMLRPEGLLVFEVPAIAAGNAQDPWLRTSLEHIHYPTGQSVRYLFETVLGFNLAGSPVAIRDFASTFAGIASKDATTAQHASSMWQRLTTAAPAELSRPELRFRWLFDVIHAANADPELLSLYASPDPEDVNPAIVQRLNTLLGSSELRTRSLRSYLRDVEAARDWQAEEVRKRDVLLGR